MDTEFVNAYINKQKALIDELQSKLLLAETKIQLIEEKHKRLTQQHNEFVAAVQAERLAAANATPPATEREETDCLTTPE